MGDAARALEELVARELFRPAPPAAERLAEEIRQRLGPGLAAVVFYGSCLRRDTPEGVLDFYAIVDGYREVYASRRLAWLNRWLPPNVFYLEISPGGPGPAGTLRAKYAVLSAEDFARATAPGGLRSSIWARFCQPTLAVFCRDEATRARLVAGGARSVRTAVDRLLPQLEAPDPGAPLDVSPAGFWRVAFRETYANEMRPESPEAAASLYDAAPERYDRALALALEILEAEGGLSLEAPGPGAQAAIRVRLDEGARRRARRAWRARRPLAKLAYAASLLKTATTFGDWLPYALWKLERHTGTRLVPSERQRRHPLIWGWPLLFRALARRDLG